MIYHQTAAVLAAFLLHLAPPPYHALDDFSDMQCDTDTSCEVMFPPLAGDQVMVDT